ncbi:MAG: phosphoribosyltransferase [Saprospiraceae bacterium]|nr:phosphoribosyltransferase [Saprospiraceae bacterium]
MAKILNDRQIGQKIRRLSIEIAEQNWEETELVLIGINNNGLHFAQLLQDELTSYLPEVQISKVNLRMNPANPIETPAYCEYPMDRLANKPIILVDDVANTGRTLFYAFRPLLDVMTKKIQIAVLVDRKHKIYPVHVDYLGLSLATTFNEHIDVQLKTPGDRAVYLT